MLHFLSKEIGLVLSQLNSCGILCIPNCEIRTKSLYHNRSLLHTHLCLVVCIIRTLPIPYVILSRIHPVAVTYILNFSIFVNCFFIGINCLCPMSIKS